MQAVHAVGFTSAGTPAAFICQTYACWGKSMSLDRDKKNTFSENTQLCPRLLQGNAPGACWGLLLQLGSAVPSAPQGPSAPTAGKHRAKGSEATAPPAPSFHPDIIIHLPAPLLPTAPGLPRENRQPCHGVMAATSCILHHAISCPCTGHHRMQTTWTKLSDARAAQRRESAAFSALLWICK